MLHTPDDLSVVLDNVGDGVTVQDRSGRLVYANAAAARVLGFPSQEELITTPAAEILNRFEMLDEAGNPFPLEQLPGRRALAGQQTAAVTIRFRAVPSSEERWASVHANPVRDSSGEILYAVNVWHDVSAQKRTENRQAFLAQAGELLSSSLDIEATLANIAQLAVPGLADWCAVHLAREDGTLAQLSVAHADPDRVAWARRLQERYPTNPDAPTGVPNVIRTGRPELIADVTDEMLVTVARSEEHLDILRRVGLRSAIIVPLAARERTLGAITFVAAESGRRYDEQDQGLMQELARRAAMAIDNARLYEAERDARARAEDIHLRFRALFEGIPDAILVLDSHDMIIDANEGACELLGYDRDALKTMRISQLVPESATEDGNLTAPPDADEWRGTTEVRRRDGGSVPVELWFRRLSLPTGVVSISTMRDISERRAADKAREEVLAAVSHDLRNPIGVIKAHVQLLQRGIDRGRIPARDQLVERLATIDAMGTRMASMLEDMTDVARSQRGEKAQLTPQPTDLVALAQRGASEMAAVSGREVGVTSDVPELVGMWDAHVIERVIHNLVNNALKYSPDGGSVEIRISRLDHQAAEISVLDEGIGIPESDRDLVFDAYHRGGNVGSISGTGIGLAGARHIVESQGGTITVTGQKPHGTAVIVRLPLQPPAAM